MTPSQLVQHFRDNQNGNKTLKTTFRNQFLGKFEFQDFKNEDNARSWAGI
jgi:hypothetical protein